MVFAARYLGPNLIIFLVFFYFKLILGFLYCQKSIFSIFFTIILNVSSNMSYVNYYFNGHYRLDKGGFKPKFKNT